MNALCAPRNGFSLQKHQLFLKSNIKKIKRILLFHGLGSGKTCTAISLAAAYANLKSLNNKKIIVVTPASLKENFYKELMSECGRTQLGKIIKTNRLYPDSALGNENVKSICSNDDTKKKQIVEHERRLKTELNKKFEIMSYQGFVKNSKLKKLDLNNTLIIIDEVQNIISNTGETYKVFLKEFQKLNTKSKVILLSGTPMFDKAFEISLLSRLLQTKKEFQKYHLPTDPRVFDATFKIDADANMNDKKIQNKQLIQQMFMGKLSYIKGSDQRAYPKKVEHDVICPMSSFQTKAYKNSIGHLNFNVNNLNVNNMSRTFLISPRQASNVLLPSGRIGKLKSIDKSFNVQKHSTKFYNCLKNIKAQNGPTFVYSNFVSKAGVEDFAEILQKVEGYQLVQKDMCPVNIGKRFAIFRTGQPDENTRILKIFNSYENRNGDIIKIILGSPAMKEGITLLRVRQIHILDPYWNRSRTEQIIGRGVRYCSHKDLPENERRVDVYHYYAVPERNPSSTPQTAKKEALDLSVDQHIRKISDFKEKSIKVVNDLLKQVAIDCEHFKDQNELPNIQCIGSKSNIKFDLDKFKNKSNNKPKNSTRSIANKKTNVSISISNIPSGTMTTGNKTVKKKPVKPWAPTKSGKTQVVKKKSKFKGCPRPRHPMEKNDGTMTCEENEKFKHLRTNPRGFPCCYIKPGNKTCDSYSKKELIRKLERSGTTLRAYLQNTKGTYVSISKRNVCDRLSIK